MKFISMSVQNHTISVSKIFLILKVKQVTQKVRLKIQKAERNFILKVAELCLRDKEHKPVEGVQRRAAVPLRRKEQVELVQASDHLPLDGDLMRFSSQIPLVGDHEVDPEPAV